MYKTYYLLFVLFSPVNIFAQCIIQGKVTDTIGKALENCVVVQQALADSSVIAVSMTDSLGKYIIYTPILENTFLYISSFSYTTAYQKVPLDGIIPSVKLYSVPIYLEEAVIQAEKPIFSRQGDKFIYVPAETLAKKSAYEALKYVPLLHVDDQGISIVGKEIPVIYINGRKSGLSQKALQLFLETVTVSQIERVEITTLPGSDKRADANNGIINVVLKKEGQKAWSGTLRVSGRECGDYGEGIGGNIFYFSDKLSLLGSASFEDSKWKGKDVNEYHYFRTGRAIQSKDIETIKEVYGFVNLSADYRWNKRQHLVLELNANFQKKEQQNEQINTISSLKFETADSVFKTRREGRGIPDINLYAGVAYSFQIDTLGSNLNIDLSYTRYPRSECYFNNFGLLEAETKNKEETEIVIENYAALCDYLKYFNSKSSLHMGMEFYTSRSDNNYFYGTLLNGEYKNDVTRTNHFLFQDYLGALFVKYNGSFSPALSFTLGIRGEYYYQKGDQERMGEKFHDGRLQIFPSAAINWNINQRHILSLAYRQGIVRPAYFMLNPFRKYSSATAYEENRTDLKSVRQHALEFSYLLRQRYIFSCTYYRFRDPWQQITLPAGKDISKTFFANFRHAENITLVASGQQGFWEDVVLVSASTVFRTDFSHGTIETTDISDCTGRLRFNFDIHLWFSKKNMWSMNFGYGYNSRPLFGKIPGDRATHNNMLRVEKGFKNSTLALAAVNVLCGDSQIKQTYETYSITKSSRCYPYYGISYTYRFGNNGTSSKNVKKSSAFNRIKE